MTGKTKDIKIICAKIRTVDVTTEMFSVRPRVIIMVFNSAIKMLFFQNVPCPF